MISGNVHRNSGARLVVLTRSRPLMAGVAKLEDGGGIARARGTRLKGAHNLGAPPWLGWRLRRS